MFIDETRDWAGGESGPSRKSTQIRTGFWEILGVDSLSVEVGRRSTCVGGVSAIDGARAPTCRWCSTGVWNFQVLKIQCMRSTFVGMVLVMVGFLSTNVCVRRLYLLDAACAESVD